jgi:hypothetical protein
MDNGHIKKEKNDAESTGDDLATNGLVQGNGAVDSVKSNQLARGRPRLSKAKRADLLGFTVTSDVKKSFEAAAKNAGKSKSEFFRLLVQTHLMADGDETFVTVSPQATRSLKRRAQKKGVSVSFFLSDILTRLDD